MSFVRKETLLVLLFVVGVGFYFVPMRNIAFNSSNLTLGVPASILSIFLASAFLVALSVFFAYFHFLPWAREKDKEEESQS